MSWRVAKSLLTLRAQYNTAHPGRSTAYDGTIGDLRHQRSKSDHNPGPDGIVQAIDLTAEGNAGRALAEAARRTMMARGQAGYVIHAGRICSSARGWTWRTYSGANPHTHHVHVSVHTQIDTTKAWLLGSGGKVVAPAKKLPPATDPRGPFPLPAGHFYGLDDGTLKSHSGARAADRYAIGLIQRKISTTATGRFRGVDAAALRKWQAAHKLTVDSKVGPATWKAM